MPSNPTALELQYISGLQQGFIAGLQETSMSSFYCGEEEDGIEDKCKVQCNSCVTPNYQQALEERWIDVNDRLPEFKHEHTGNKLTDKVLVWNGQDQFLCYLEAVRPDFTTLIWSFEYDFENMPDDFDVENLEYKGKPITHWMPLFPNPKENS